MVAYKRLGANNAVSDDFIRAQKKTGDGGKELWIMLDANDAGIVSRALASLAKKY